MTERSSKSVDRTIQIFVKVEGRTLPVEMSPSDQVGDIVARETSSARGGGQDMYVMCEGKVFFWKNDELKSCGVLDGSIVQVTSKMRSGGRHKDKEEQSGEEAEGKSSKFGADARSENGG